MISPETLRLVKKGLSDYEEYEIKEIIIKKKCSFYQAAEIYFKGDLRRYM